MVMSRSPADLAPGRLMVDAELDPSAETGAAAVAPSGRRTLLIACGAFSLTWLAFYALAHVAPDHLGAAQLEELGELLVAGAALVAVALGTLMLVQRRVSPTSGRTFGTGLALIVEGALVLYVGQLYPLSQPVAHPPFAALASPAAIIVAIGLLGWGSFADQTPSPGWSATRWILAAGSLGGLITLFRFHPSVAQALSTTLPSSHASAWTAGQLLLAASWSVVAGLALLRPAGGSLGLRDVAVGLVALSLAQSRVVLADTGAGSWSLGAHVFQLTGFAVAFALVAREFNRRMHSREEELMDSLINVCTHAARRQARQMVEAVRRHDTHSALFAVSGAAQLLADRYGELTDAQRAALTGILTDGVGQLSGLTKVRPEEVEELDIDQVVRSIVAAERDSNVAVTSAVPAGLRGVGCAADLAVVVQILIRLAQGRPVVVRGSQERGFIILTVEATDSSLVGCPVGPLQDSLDLEVASRLMVEHGGTVSMGDANGHGVLFGLRLPAVSIADLEMEKGAFT
jgi:signal transduction histidine kinase